MPEVTFLKKCPRLKRTKKTEDIVQQGVQLSNKRHKLVGKAQRSSSQVIRGQSL